MFINCFSKINRFKMVPRWSVCSWTPLATSTNPTMGSTASTSYVHQKLTWHMFICCFSKTNRFKTVPAWYRVIKRLLDTLSDLDKLDQGEYSKYQLCSSKINMTHVCMLFFKEKSNSSGSRVTKNRSKTPSATSSSSTMASTASTSYVHQNFTWHIFLYYFSKINRFNWSQDVQDALGLPQWPHQVQTWRVQKVRDMFIKKWSGPRLIKLLSDNLSDLGKVNHGW